MRLISFSDYNVNDEKKKIEIELFFYPIFGKFDYKSHKYRF